jgi:hypothetical protein
MPQCGHRLATAESLHQELPQNRLCTKNCGPDNSRNRLVVASGGHRPAKSWNLLGSPEPKH